MPNSIDRETALQVAKLARIHLSDQAAPETQNQLSKILGYISKLNELDIPESVEPFFGVVESVNAIRTDVTRESFAREQILANAPDSDGEFYRVPPVFK